MIRPLGVWNVRIASDLVELRQFVPKINDKLSFFPEITTPKRYTKIINVRQEQYDNLCDKYVTDYYSFAFVYCLHVAAFALLFLIMNRNILTY